MFEDWLSIDGWVEWVASVKFSDDTLTQESIESVFMSAVASLALERPSIIASIERTDQGPSFVFNPIADMAYLHTRVSQIANVVQVDDTLESGVTTITDQFYAETDKRISIELGPSLMQLTMVRSSLSKEAGKYAILLRSHHSLNDFLSGMAMFDGILSKIAKRKGPDVSLLSSTEDRLHPCYIDLLREPVDHYTSTEAETAKASEIMGKVSISSSSEQPHLTCFIVQQMANITIWPNKQEPAQETSTTDYAVKRKTFTEETTSKLVSVCKKHGVTVTALLLAIQTVAVLMTFPPDDENRTEAILNLVSNRLTKTTLFDVTMDETEVTSNGSNADTRSTARRRAQKAATTGPIMATNFVLAPCDVGVYVDAKKQYGTEDAWRKCIWQVANSVKKTIQNTASQNFTEKAYWTEGPTGFGIIAMALSAMKSGAAPV
jgi:hypothetical protein